MPLDGASPRVTLGIATYNRHDYLAEAIRSALEQDFTDLEVLVVLDGTTNPLTDEVLHSFEGEPRLRVVRHETNRGIAAAYNTFVSEGRGELIAMIGDDDLCLPGRIRRQVEIFDRHPETGVVHGDAIVIDAGGRQTGVWPSREFTPSALIQSFFRSHNHLVDPSRMVHRRVHDAVGGYDDRFPLANDFDFFLRAGRTFRFRHVPGGPLVAIRRHGANTSDESARARELADVEGALAAAVELYPLRELVPELDWAVLNPADAERQALLRLADALEQRMLPVPGLAAELRSRAAAIAAVARSRPVAGSPADAGGRPRRLLMTAFGWNDSGGGTTVPRLAAKELARRGWEVTVFHAAVKPSASGEPYEVREWDEDGVHLIGVHNRPHGLFDLGHPDREIDDPAISAAFAQVLEQTRPDVVHFHNLHNLGASLMDHVAARGLPAYFTTHNYWLICPRAYLLTGEGAICAGPGDGARCAACVGSPDVAGHQRRLAEIRSRAERGLTTILSVSDAVRHTLVNAGYPADLVDTVRQAMPHDAEIWEQVGRDRAPGRVSADLTVAFLGSAYPHKGPQLLIEAAQRTQARLNIKILGEVPARFAEQLKALDRRGNVELCGAFSPSEIGGLLRSVDAVALPSMWWDCAPLAAAECLAARTPVLVPRLGGLPEAIRDGVDGLTFDGLDVDDLARVLDRLASEAGLLERLQAGITAPRAFGEYVDELEAYYGGARPSRVDGGVGGDEVAVRWQGDHGLPTSLSIINDRVSSRLAGPVLAVGRDGGDDAAAPAPPLVHTADVEVRHQWPPDFRPARAGRLAMIQPWEFGAVPEAWLEPLHSTVDELWVPSEFVRAMYVEAGVDPERVVTIPNGVDLSMFSPDGDQRDLPGTGEGTRFLFVGGLITRKGADVLFDTWREAFAGRDDVTLVLKDFGAGDIYRNAGREPILEHIAAGALPRIVLVDEDLSTEEVAALYRACDVLVHPYRGEGFAMPVLEAMACGLPVIVTAGGPTDEFVPDEAGWRIAAERVWFAEDRIDTLDTHGRPWLLEPDRAELVALLRQADAADDDELEARGQAGRAAAEHYGWDAVAACYQERIVGLAARRPRPASAAVHQPFPLEEEVSVRVLATPAWRGSDRLGELLAQWVGATARETSACLYLLADPGIDGSPEELEAHILSAAETAGVDIDGGADINVLMEPAVAERDLRLHLAVDAYVPVHDGCSGHARLAREVGNVVLGLDGGELATRLAGAAAETVGQRS
ncbi:MAG TPA: glycosyltransferase [Solirubrobacteraceae bacterium]|nr:glycosyltransferase [Solirubrobacteraceae bacterium]